MNRPVHFEILGDKPQELADFYQAVLGWEVGTWDGPQAYWLLTTGPDGTPGINGAIMERHFPQGVINTIEVESLDEASSKVEQAGGKVINGPNDIPGVGRHSYCEDPEGNLFGLLQPSMEEPEE
ncbi:MAG TPA: VOC family protein [bacterium]|nr:VOC family protein [bacterium]